MNMSMKRIQAIFMKDYKEFSRNYAVSAMVFMPIFLAFFFNKMGVETIQDYLLPINTTLAMVTAFVQCCLMAEEKENNTLRSLTMSPASIADILVGKSSLVFIITAITMVLSIYLVGYEPANVIVLILALVISTVFYIALGTICGLYTKTVMEATITVMPVVIVFLVGSLLPDFSGKFPILAVAEWLPSSQLILLVESLEAATPAKELIVPFVVMIAWTVVALAVTTVLYKKRMTDD